MKLVRMDTLRDPRTYTQQQIEHALQVAYMLGRGKFILLLEPEGDGA